MEQAGERDSLKKMKMEPRDPRCLPSADIYADDSSEGSETEEAERLASSRGQTKGVHIERDCQILSFPAGQMEEKRTWIQMPACLFALLLVLVFVVSLVVVGVVIWGEITLSP